MLKLRSLDQKMTKSQSDKNSVSRRQNHKRCLQLFPALQRLQLQQRNFQKINIFNALLLLAVLISESLASTTNSVKNEEKQFYQKLLIEDLVHHSNSLLIQKQAAVLSHLDSNKFDIKFKGNNVNNRISGGLKIKFHPAIAGASVNVYNLEQNNKRTTEDNNKSSNYVKRTYETEADGIVSLSNLDYKPDSEICIVARALGVNHMFWWQRCLKFPSHERKTEININLENAETQVHRLKLIGEDPDGTTFFANLPLDGVTVALQLSSEVTPSLRHSDALTLSSDGSGNVLIFTNAQISGTAIVNENKDYESFSSTLSFDADDVTGNREHLLRLTAVCPEHLAQEATFTSLSTLTESVGLGQRPLIEDEAIEAGWRKVNTICTEEAGTPGFRYENPSTTTEQFLVLIYDVNRILVGVQLALPENLADPNFNYDGHSMYNRGTYDGEEAFLLTLYFGDRSAVCSRKSKVELICADGLGGNDGRSVAVVTKDDEFPLYLSEQEAKANNWVPQSDISQRENYLTPPGALTGNKPSPYLAIYRDSKLTGMTIMHATQMQKHQAFENTIFESASKAAGVFSDQNNFGDGAMAANFYFSDDDKVNVQIRLQLGDDAHHYPRKYFYWTDSGDHGERHQHGGTISSFMVRTSAKLIHVFGYHESSANVHYAIVKVDPCRGSHDVQATIHRGKKSRIEIHETQSGHGLGGSHVTLFVGVGSQHAMEAKFIVGSHSTVYLDTPKGLLVAWRIDGPKNQRHLPHPDESHSITPFHERRHLLKTVNMDIHICLESSEGRSHDATDKDAVVEVNLEYEWASQDDSREIIPVDYRGHVTLKNVPSPLPGENLNVTLISRINRQISFGPSMDFHRTLAVASHTVKYHNDGPIHISLCHQREQVAVVVTNSVTHLRIPGVKVVVDSDNFDERLMDEVTDSNGVAYFSFTEEDDVSEYYVIINELGYDRVQVWREAREDHETEVIHIELRPKQHLRVQVVLENEGAGPAVAAVGAVVEFTFGDSSSGVAGVDENGFVDVWIPGRVDTLVQLTASLPWQSSCGYEVGSDATLPKRIFGLASLTNENFPIEIRDSNEAAVERRLVLPEIKFVRFEVGLDGTFPDVALFSSDLMAMRNTVEHLEEKILHNEISVDVQPGSRHASLLTVEWYNTNIVATPLNPCRLVNSNSVTGINDNELVVTQTVYTDTVKVTVKTVDADFQPINNVTLEYMLSETEFGLQSIEVTEAGEVFFHVPYGMLVSLEPKTPHIPDPMNPNYFVAKEGLEVYLVFDTKNAINVIVELMGEDFNVPADTLVRYIAVDADGETISSESLYTDDSARVFFRTRRSLQYIEFSIAGSDGFDPVFYQPFEYVYNVTDPYWDPPLMIEIPVRTLKNVIVAVRDCYTGNVIGETEISVTVPEDAPRWNSWFNPELMPNNHEGHPDEQGLVFFNLEPDRMVPVRVSADGYNAFEDKINIQPNVTYFVEANLCRNVEISLKLVDAANQNSPVSHATIRVGFGDAAAAPVEVKTNNAGKAKFLAPTNMRQLTLQVVDADEDVVDPIIELHDEDNNFLKEADIDIVVLERMYTLRFIAGSCGGLSKTYPDLSVHVSVCYTDSCQPDSNNNNIVMIEPQSHTEHQDNFVVRSTSKGEVVIRVFESAKAVVGRMLMTSRTADLISVGLIKQNEFPKRFSVQIHNLPKSIVVSVRDHHDDPISGSEVSFDYTDPNSGSGQTQVATSDSAGRAEINIDGCVDRLSFIVNPPPSADGHSACFSDHRSRHLSPAKTSNINVFIVQKFKIKLEESDHHRAERKIRLSIRSGVPRPDEVRATADIDLSSPVELNRHADPFFNTFHLELPSRARRVFIVESDRSESRMGLVDVSICCQATGKSISVDGFQGSVEMSLRIVDEDDNPVKDARITWHLGHGLGTTYVPVNSRGHATLFAPPGEPVVLRPVGSSCGQHQELTIVDAHHDGSVTLRCRR